MRELTDLDGNLGVADGDAVVAAGRRSDLTIYDRVAENWWSEDIRWVRTSKNPVPGRLAWFDHFVDWDGRDVLDLGCAGAVMAETMDERGARVTGIDPAKKAIAAARRHAEDAGRAIRYDTINRNPIARLAAITLVEDVPRLLPKGTHDPQMFIKPCELAAPLQTAGLRPGPTKGLGPRGINWRGDFTFGPLPLRTVIYMGVDRKPGGG